MKLPVDAVAHLVARAESDARVAAVAPKTLFWRTPAFINGVGNRVGASNWEPTSASASWISVSSITSTRSCPRP